MELKTGEARWGKVETHAADNPGTADIRLMIIELSSRKAQKESNMGKSEV